MEMVLTRIAKKKGYTIGKLGIEPLPSAPLSSPEGDTKVSAQKSKEAPSGAVGGAFCDTLEPTWRDYLHGARKIKGCSAIPEGRYAVVISWSPKMKEWLPILLGVPMFKGIRIHAGNTAKDTEGCILVGENRKVGMVVNSRIWLKRLKDKIVEAKERGEGVWITIR